MSIVRPVAAALVLAVTGLAVALAVTVGPAAAAPAPGKPPAGAPYPRASLCVDQTGALGSQTCTRIAQVLRADEAASKDEIAVAVVRTTGGASIETWGTGLFNAWGVGKQDKNNGVLLVVAVSDRRLRIVTGTGLASRLPDGEASEIVGGTITPLLRAGRTRDAVLAGLDAIRRGLDHRVTAANALAAPGTTGLPAVDAGAPDFATEEPAEVVAPDGSMIPLIVVLLAITVGGILLRRALGGSGGDEDGSGSDGDWGGSGGYRRRSYRSFRSSGSRSSRRSGGSSRSRGFGGGRSRGGGASGSW